MEPPLPRRLGLDDLDDAVEIMTQAFFDDPLWTYLIQDKRRRRKLLPEFFRRFLRRGIESEEVYGAGRPLQGVAVWVMAHHGGEWISRPSEEVYLELLLDPMFTSSSSARSLFSTLDKLQMRYAPGPHMYLSSIGVAAEARGRGVASLLIRPFLAMADVRSLPIYTETVKASNIPLYEHFHFVVVQSVGISGSGLTIWSLLRCPRT
jgi:ribosomal protein S18 acetylase RimI-like enzyme